MYVVLPLVDIQSTWFIHEEHWCQLQSLANIGVGVGTGLVGGFPLEGPIRSNIHVAY